MAVENKYTDSLVAAGKLAVLANPSPVFCLPFTFELAAADDDGSIYRIAKNVPADLILVRADIHCDTVTAGTNYDLGLYDSLEMGGAVVDKDAFAEGLDLSTAKPLSGAGLFGVKDVDIANIRKRLWEIAGHTISTKRAGYDIALTGDTVGSAAVTVSGLLWFVQG